MRTPTLLVLALALPALAQEGPAVARVADAELPDFGADDFDRAALRRAITEEKALAGSSGPRAIGGPGGVEVTRERLLRTLDRLDGLLAQGLEGEALAAAITSGFECWRSVGRDGQGTVLFTAYHSPCYEASRTRTERLDTAVRRAPEELLARPGGFSPAQPFFTRREIDGEGKLDGRGLELVWMARLDAYLLEVQGSGSARLQDGTVVNLQCSRGNGHPYTSLGKELVKDGKLTAAEASIPAIRRHFAAHPDEQDEYLFRNAAYVFFEETTRPPLGCGGAPVTAGRSIATDKRLFPTGALAFIVVELPIVEQGEVKGWRRTGRLMVDQDTGGAIRGAGRVDIYLGADDAAELGAGVMKRDGALYYLLARE